MPELSDLLHRCVDDVDVPRPDIHRISTQGRSLRTRRRLGAAVAAAVVLAAVGGGLALAERPGGESRGNDVADRSEAPTPYDAWAAWSIGDAVTVGTSTVRVPGQAVHLAQTSTGVVVKSLLDDGSARFTLVRPDGEARRLGIPADTPTVDGDLTAPRVAWVESRTGELVLHVWDVTRDAEVGRVVVPSPGSTPESGSQYIRESRLDGDAAYFTTQDETPRRVLWRSGEVADFPLMPASVRAGVAVAHQAGRWEVLDAASGQVRRRITGDPVTVQVSADGQWLFLGGSESHAVEPVAGGERVRLDGISILATWTRDGAVVGQKGTSPAMLRCTTAGRCTERAVAAEPMDAVLVADFLNAG